MMSCVHCGSKDSEFVQDDDNGLICTSCGMVVESGALLESRMDIDEQGQIGGKLVFESTARLGTRKSLQICQYKQQIEQAGNQLGADGEVIQSAKDIFESFVGELGRIDVRIASALYAAGQECRKPVRLTSCMAAAGVPENIRKFKAKVIGVYARQNIEIPYQNPESSLALRLLEDRKCEVVKVLKKSIGSCCCASLCLKEQVHDQILQTAQKLIEFFDIAEAAQVSHTAADRLMVAIMMASNYHRQLIRVRQDIMPLWMKLSSKKWMTRHYCYAIYAQIKRGIEGWARRNLAQEVTDVAYGIFELRYFDAIFALFDLHKRAKQEEISEKLNRRFQTNNSTTNPLNNHGQCMNIQNTQKISANYCMDIQEGQNQQSDQCMDIQQLQKQQSDYCMDIQQVQNQQSEQCMDIQQLQNQQSDQCMDIQLLQSQQTGQCMDIQNADKQLVLNSQDESDLSELDDDEVRECIKSQEEVIRDTLIFEFFNSQFNQTKKSNRKIIRKKERVKRKRNRK